MPWRSLTSLDPREPIQTVEPRSVVRICSPKAQLAIPRSYQWQFLTRVALKRLRGKLTAAGGGDYRGGEQRNGIVTRTWTRDSSTI
jgi:hypothetical protein